MAPRVAPNWPRAKALHEQGKSFSQIHDALGIPLRTLKYRAKNEKWEKGKLAPRLHQKEQQALESEAARHGVTKGKVFEKVAELMGAKKTEFYKGSLVCDVEDNGTQLGATSLAADLLSMKRNNLDLTTGGRSLLDEVIDEA